MRINGGAEYIVDCHLSPEYNWLGQFPERLHLPILGTSLSTFSSEFPTRQVSQDWDRYPSIRSVPLGDRLCQNTTGLQHWLSRVDHQGRVS